jgi:hypothetical protein
MAAGALAGVLASLLLRLPIRGVWKNALLGVLGFAAFFVTILVTRLGPSLINNFIDPVRAALVFATLCPVVREVLRFRNARSNRATNSAQL